MPTFNLAIASVKTAYDNYVTAQGVTASAQATLDGYGAKPTYPNIVITDPDWNSVTSSILNYNNNTAVARSILVTAQNSQRTLELAVIAALGYNSGADLGICLDQWVKVVGAGGGPLTYTHWVGAGFLSTYLTVLTAAPTQAYPNH